jgi:hypothetical protein
MMRIRGAALAALAFCALGAPQDAQEAERKHGEEQESHEGHDHTSHGDEADRRERAGDDRRPELSREEYTRFLRMLGAEDTQHRRMMARLARLEHIARESGDRGKLERVGKLTRREVVRHNKKLDRLRKATGPRHFDRMQADLATWHLTGIRPDRGGKPAAKERGGDAKRGAEESKRDEQKRGGAR